MLLRCTVGGMASIPSLPVSVECVNICKFVKGEASVRHDCSVLSCAWKAPRVLTGFLASTADPSHCSATPSWETARRLRVRYRCDAFDEGVSYYNKASNSKRRSSLLHIGEVSPEMLWEDLKPTILYLSSEELELVYDALKLAFEAHDGQKRRSGEPFIIHPVEVARILGELELDWESIAAGLLHDTVEDTNSVTFERIEKQFGTVVRRIVEGETKVSKLGKIKCKQHKESVQDIKAEDLRQMFLAMTEEVRVIIVKLADRLHNMRTLSHLPPHKQSSIAMETLEVFAPLARLLGMYQIKSELENLSFMYTNAQDYAKIKRRVTNFHREHEKELAEANQILIKQIEDDQFLGLMAMDTEVRAVCKEPYSIYKAVIKSECRIYEVNQIAQLRIIIKPKPSIGGGPLCSEQQVCYHALGLVHGTWIPIPRAMKDYIATPKPNGYRSLHTMIIPFLYESMFRLEVLIRTEEMDLIAERGIAAHYCGRVFVNGLVGHAKLFGRSSIKKSACLNNANIALKIGWLNAIREWQEEFVGNMSSREFVDTITRDLLGSRIFVFTPRGEIKNLPKGATAIDYAYMIHTEIGNKMVAAKVNGNIVSPKHILTNAEVVEIITYNAISSKSSLQRHKKWLQHAKTRSARHKIMKFLREQAVLSASEITADRVTGFVAGSEETEFEGIANYFKGRKATWEEVLINVTETLSPRKVEGDILCFENISSQPLKINGKHNKHLQHASFMTEAEMLSLGSGVSRMSYTNISLYKEVLPGLQSWRTGKIASWHNLEGLSIQWLCLVIMDRKGLMSEITAILAGVGINICSCVVDTDRGKGIAVLLFHIDGSHDSLVQACESADLVMGIIEWSAGCSWPNSIEKDRFLEC